VVEVVCLTSTGIFSKLKKSMRVYTAAIDVACGTFRSSEKGLDWIYKKEAKRVNAHAHE
jgi:hypothetical protein